MAVNLRSCEPSEYTAASRSEGESGRNEGTAALRRRIVVQTQDVA
jgi:hypothetical protein